MRFVVKRTSQGIADESPCEEARRGTYRETTIAISATRHDDRIQVDAQVGEDEVPAWFVEIRDLAELCEFVKRYGDIVVQQVHMATEDLFCIEIYDTYRE